ncbi:MAG TPA: DUF6531 domain-containing protein, partial [Solirubrobacteraceae bacterium]|nr:DUF6531 domain-containing protein [Solirubrobacteraceae bacterium]
MFNVLRGRLSRGRLGEFVGRIGRLIALGQRVIAASLLILVATAILVPVTLGSQLVDARMHVPRTLNLAGLPLSVRMPISRAIGSKAGAYRIRGSLGSLDAANRAQRLSMHFSSDGVALSSGLSRFNLDTIAAGYGRSLHRLQNVTPRSRRNRVEYRRAPFSEWYVNGPAGLEQGFTLAQAGRNHPSDFTIAMTVSGSANPGLIGKGTGVTLSHAGNAPITYGDLTATDARARRLHAWATLNGKTVLIHVNTVGAKYPIRVDPLIAVGGELTANRAAGSGIVALSANGKTALVGIPCGSLGEKEAAEAESDCRGKALVFKRFGAVWQEQATLTAEGEVGQGFFGSSVALSENGNTALVGAEADNDWTGAAWVFVRSGATWSQQGEKLTGGEEVDGLLGGQFGTAVALSSSGDTALVGGFCDENCHGAAWVFTRAGSSWSQQGAKLTGGEEGGSYRLFGESVGLSGNGDTAIVAGPDAKAGGAWLFTRSGETWTQQGAELTGEGLTNEGCGFQFAASVAIASEGNTILIGGRETCEAPGAAWVYTRSGEAWSQQAHFTGTETSVSADFGASVALSADGDTAAVGGPTDHSDQGAVWQFKRTGSSWSQSGPKLVESGSEQFGLSVALSEDGATTLAASRDGSVLGWIFRPGTLDPRTQRGGENPSAPKHPCPVCGDPVVASTGDFYQTQTDISVGGRGVGLDLARTYNSQSA